MIPQHGQEARHNHILRELLLEQAGKQLQNWAQPFFGGRVKPGAGKEASLSGFNLHGRDQPGLAQASTSLDGDQLASSFWDYHAMRCCPPSTVAGSRASLHTSAVNGRGRQSLVCSLCV